MDKETSPSLSEILNLATKNKIPGIFRFMELSMKIIGIHPDVFKVDGFVIVLGLSILSVPFFVLNALEARGEMNQLMDTLALFIPVVSLIWKLTCLRLSHRNVKYLIKEILEDYKGLKGEDIRKALMKNMRISGIIHAILVFSYNSVASTYVIINVVSIIKAESLNNVHYVIPVAYPFIPKTAINYTFIDLLSLIQMFISSYGHALIDGLLAVAILHAATQVQDLRSAIRKYSQLCCKLENNEEVKEAIKYVFSKHQKFLKFADNIEAAYSYVSLANMIMVTFNMVTFLFVLVALLDSGNLNGQFLFYANFFAVDLWTLATFCVAGEYFIILSEDIYTELCQSTWYQFDINNMKAMTIFLAKTKKPVVLTPGKFSNLSLILFSNIIKLSYSYASVFRVVRRS